MVSTATNPYIGIEDLGGSMNGLKLRGGEEEFNIEEFENPLNYPKKLEQKRSNNGRFLSE